MYTFKILTKIDPVKWNEDLMKSDDATSFQTYEHLDPPSGADYFTIFIYVLDDNGNVVGQIGLRIIKTVVMFGSPLLRRLAKIISKITSRGVWVYGPIIHSADKNSGIEVLQCILQAIDVVSEKYDLVHLEGFSPPYNFSSTEEYRHQILSHGYVVNDYETFIADLGKNIDDIWKNVSKKTRGDVNRAKRRNITVQEITDYEDLKKYLTLSQQWAKTKGLQITDPFNEIETLWRNYKLGLDKFFLAYQDKELISGLRISCFNGKAMTNSVVSSYSKPTSLGGTLLTWYALETVKSQGMKVFDFTGGMRQDDSEEKDEEKDDESKNGADTLLFYKKKWGGEKHPYFHLLKIRKKNTYRIYRLLFHAIRFYHKMR